MGGFPSIGRGRIPGFRCGDGLQSTHRVEVHMGDFENRKRGCIDSQESGGEKFSDRWGHRTWVKRYVGYVKKIGIRALKSKDIAFFANETPMLSPPGLSVCTRRILAVRTKVERTMVHGGEKDVDFLRRN